MKWSSHRSTSVGVLRRHECHIHRRDVRAPGDRVVPVRAPERATATAQDPYRDDAVAELLQAGDPGDPLVPRRHSCQAVAVDNQISSSTGCAYLHDGIGLLAAHAPGLESVLLAAKMAGYAHVNIDGTLIETDRCRRPRSRSRRTAPAPTSRSSSTRPTTASAPSANAETPCSRPPSKHCATSASAPGTSAGSPRQPRTPARRAQPHNLITERHDPLRGKAQYPLG